MTWALYKGRSFASAAKDDTYLTQTANQVC